MAPPRLPVATDAFMAEQQLRAELEAEAWRRMREAYALPPPPEPAALPAPANADPSLGGSIILKALVRFAMGASVAYVAYIAALDAGLGTVDGWLAAGGAFLITLALSLLPPFRRIVHALAETARWAIIAGVGLGALWYALNQANLTG